MSCGARPCMLFGLMWLCNETLVPERKCALHGSVCMFVFVCGRWVNHTGNTWQKDIISAQYEGVQKKHQLLSEVNLLVCHVFMFTIYLCTILFKVFAFSQSSLFSPGGPWFTSIQWISDPPVGRPITWTGLTLSWHLCTSCRNLSLQII